MKVRGDFLGPPRSNICVNYFLNQTRVFKSFGENKKDILMNNTEPIAHQSKQSLWDRGIDELLKI